MPDPLRDLKTVHHRHPHIKEDYLVLLTAFGRAAQDLEGFLARSGLGDRGSAASERFTGDKAVGFVVS